MRWDRFASFLTALLCVLATPAAFAGFTPIGPPHPGEDSHAQILSHIYGGTFSPVGSLNFSNGLVTANRVEDFIVEEGNPTGGEDASDQTWRAQFTNAVAEARFAAFSQEFGYFQGSTGGSYIPLFPVVGEGYGVTGEAVIPLLANQLLRWGRNGDNGIFSSKIADNTDNRDHMVTYQIFDEQGTAGGGQGIFRWLVLWEDIRDNEPFEDWDFNDLAVEITAVPEPTSVAALGLVSLLVLRRRRD
jgi:hypothetical protein